MKKRDYDTMYDETTGGTETHVATDTKMRLAGKRSNHAHVEGFASASGVRPETAESGGRIRHPETKDASRPDAGARSVEEENAGLAE